MIGGMPSTYRGGAGDKNGKPLTVAGGWIPGLGGLVLSNGVIRGHQIHRIANKRGKVNTNSKNNLGIKAAVDGGGRGLGLCPVGPWTSGRLLGVPGGLAWLPGGQKGLRGHLLEAGLHGSLWGARPQGHLKSPLDGPGVDTEGRGRPRWTEGLASRGQGGRGWTWGAGDGRGTLNLSWTLQTGHRSRGLRGGRSWRPCLEAETGRLRERLTPGRRGPSGRPDGPGGEES